jgi:hypothetical protein
MHAYVPKCEVCRNRTCAHTQITMCAHTDICTFVVFSHKDNYRQLPKTFSILRHPTFLPDVLTTLKKPWEEIAPSIPLTEDTDRVYRPSVLDFIEKQGPEFLKAVKSSQHVWDDTNMPCPQSERERERERNVRLFVIMSQRQLPPTAQDIAA